MIMQLNTSRDIHFELSQNGNIIKPFGITGFSSGEESGGDWHGEIRLDRSHSHLELAVARDPVFLIIATVSDPDGTRVEFKYHAARLRFASAGEWVSDKLGPEGIRPAFVPQVIKFTAIHRSVSPIDQHDAG